MRSAQLAAWAWAFSLAMAVLLTGCGPSPVSTDSSPISISQDPEQESLPEPAPIQRASGSWQFVLTPVASYILRGVVLSEEDYWTGWNSDLSPCDVAVAWGPLVQGDVWKQLTWSQTGRWYLWEYDSNFAYDNTFVARYSSNNHIIPATSRLGRAARKLSKGDLVELSGDLVRVSGQRGPETVSWSSSMSRADMGDGSCEIIYLKRLRVDGKVYE